jgi:hypothetical protein
MNVLEADAEQREAAVLAVLVLVNLLPTLRADAGRREAAMRWLLPLTLLANIPILLLIGNKAAAEPGDAVKSYK